MDKYVQKSSLFTNPDLLFWDIQRDFSSFFQPGESGWLPCEMSCFENAFLMGLIRKFHPRKILEVGVSTGATTTMILEYLSRVNSDAELWSVDINESYYRDSAKSTGFIALERFGGAQNWHLLTGRVLPEYMPTLGEGIDFCILDTVHSLPGELLDFLVIISRIKCNSIIVLHDTSLYLRKNASDEYSKHCYATKVVFDSAVGDKIVCKDTSSDIPLPNISAIRTTNDTYKHIENSFFALGMPWFYIPSDEILCSYRKYYVENYDKKYVDLFDAAILAQKNHRGKIIASHAAESIQHSHEIAEHNNTIHALLKKMINIFKS